MLRPARYGVTLFGELGLWKGGPILLANTKPALTLTPVWRLWAGQFRGPGPTPLDTLQVPRPPRLLRLPACLCPSRLGQRPLPRQPRPPTQLRARGQIDSVSCFQWFQRGHFEAFLLAGFFGVQFIVEPYEKFCAGDHRIRFDGQVGVTLSIRRMCGLLCDWCVRR